jgi:hypothetical protein
MCLWLGRIGRGCSADVTPTASLEPPPRIARARPAHLFLDRPVATLHGYLTAAAIRALSLTGYPEACEECWHVLYGDVAARVRPAHLHPSVMRSVHERVLISACSGALFSMREDREVKTLMIALSAAVLIAAAPAVFAKAVSSKTASAEHKVLRKHHPGVANYALRRETQAKGRTMGRPGAFGYAPGAQPVVRDMTDILPYGGGAGSGGAGGGGGM